MYISSLVSFLKIKEGTIYNYTGTSDINQNCPRKFGIETTLMVSEVSDEKKQSGKCAFIQTIK